MDTKTNTVNDEEEDLVFVGADDEDLAASSGRHSSTKKKDSLLTYSRVMIVDKTKLEKAKLDTASANDMKVIDKYTKTEALVTHHDPDTGICKITCDIDSAKESLRASFLTTESVKQLSAEAKAALIASDGKTVDG